MDEQITTQVQSLGQWEGREIRTIEHPTLGKLWMAKDIVEGVDLQWKSVLSIAHVPEEFRTPQLNRGVTGEKETWFLTQDGVNFFLFRSRSPKAIPFQKWLAKAATEIQTTGAYVSKSITPDQTIALSTMIQTMLESLLRERDISNSLYRQLEESNSQLVKVSQMLERCMPIVRKGEISKSNGGQRCVLRRATLVAPHQKYGSETPVLAGLDLSNIE